MDLSALYGLEAVTWDHKRNNMNHKSTIHTNTALILKTEHELEAVLFCVGVPMRPVPVACVVGLIFDFSSRNAESNSLVWFSSNLEKTS